MNVVNSHRAWVYFSQKLLVENSKWFEITIQLLFLYVQRWHSRHTSGRHEILIGYWRNIGEQIDEKEKSGFSLLDHGKLFSNARANRARYIALF